MGRDFLRSSLFWLAFAASFGLVPSIRYLSQRADVPQQPRVAESPLILEKLDDEPLIVEAVRVEDPVPAAGVGPDPEPDYFGFIGPFEGGHRGGVYDPNPHDGRAEPTVGVGHFMDRGDSRETFQEVFGDDVNWNDVYHGRAELTETQGEDLFDHDMQTYINRARARIGDFDELPASVQEGIVNAFYRGDIGPQTIKLINEDRWNEVVDEYLNHNGYRTARDRGMGGIVTRMDANAQRFRDFAEGLEEGR